MSSLRIRAVALIALAVIAVTIAQAKHTAAANQNIRQAPPPAMVIIIPSAMPVAITTTPTPKPTPEPTPKPMPTYEPDKAEVEMLARLIWGEARGVPSTAERAAVVWCVLNRVDNPRWPDTIAEVVTQRKQFTGYSPDAPAIEEHKALAADVLCRWMAEQNGETDVGRVLPPKYLWFGGDGTHNHFRNQRRFKKHNRKEIVWDWTLPDPYTEGGHKDDL